MDPTASYESFLRYIANLNALLKRNLPFLKAKYGITTIQIMSTLKDGGILSKSIKKRWFERKATILVQFTTK